MRWRRDQLDVQLVDVELQDEIHVLMRLMEVASSSAQRLDAARIDTILFDG
ncbi:MAG TPA: hypothetical protein VFM09_02265 [Marmoricola sp.]|nr:hypothetical protein [Marmoricola sp.]